MDKIIYAVKNVIKYMYYNDDLKLFCEFGIMTSTNGPKSYEHFKR